MIFDSISLALKNFHARFGLYSYGILSKSGKVLSSQEKDGIPVAADGPFRLELDQVADRIGASRKKI